jgi:SAM-dependent methyltransferase
MSGERVERRRTRRGQPAKPNVMPLPDDFVESAQRAADAARHQADIENNRAAWNRWAPDYFAPGLQAWEAEEPSWGIWATPESELKLLEEVGEDTDAVELGCGTAYVCSWLAARGAIPVGVDVAEAQLESARLLQKQFDLEFPLVRASADDVPFADESFDFAISEYGASTWLDPERWVPEAARLLRPGGQLVFIANGTLLMACTPADGVEAGTELVRDYFGLSRCEFPEDNTVEHHVGYGDWIRILRRSGLAVEDLIEVRPPEDAVARYDFVSVDWARRWPSEEVWKARKLG